MHGGLDAPRALVAVVVAGDGAGVAQARNRKPYRVHGRLVVVAGVDVDKVELLVGLAQEVLGFGFDQRDVIAVAEGVEIALGEFELRRVAETGLFPGEVALLLGPVLAIGVREEVHAG